MFKALCFVLALVVSFQGRAATVCRLQSNLSGLGSSLLLLKRNNFSISLLSTETNIALDAPVITLDQFFNVGFTEKEWHSSSQKEGSDAYYFVGNVPSQWKERDQLVLIVRKKYAQVRGEVFSGNLVRLNNDSGAASLLCVDLVP